MATALAIYLARAGHPADGIRRIVAAVAGYDLSATVADIRRGSTFEIKAWVSVPQALVCALEATSFEDALRNAVSLGADADTQANHKERREIPRQPRQRRHHAPDQNANRQY